MNLPCLAFMNEQANCIVLSCMCMKGHSECRSGELKVVQEECIG